MELSAIVMMIIGLGCTWGGAIFCIRRAMQADKGQWFKPAMS